VDVFDVSAIKVKEAGQELIPIKPQQKRLEGDIVDQV
jgi:hypothetical protein